MCVFSVHAYLYMYMCAISNHYEMVPTAFLLIRFAISNACYAGAHVILPVFRLLFFRIRHFALT